MELSLALAMVPFLTAGAGAYLGSYLKKKGQNLATHEDIDKLVDQVRAVTTTTKEIEAKISDDFWHRQKRWELKRDTLFELTKQMGLASLALTELRGAFLKFKEEMTPEERDSADGQYEKWNDVAFDFEQAILIAELTCTPELKKQLLVYTMYQRRMAKEIGEGQRPIYDTLRDDWIAKRTALLRAIRKELEIGS